MQPIQERQTVATVRPLNAVLLFAPTIFLSAWLLFLIQPMFAKMALPLLGGAPNVWNTAMVFFQAALLAGYLYAHLLSRLLAPRYQLAVHLAVLVSAFIVLPVGIGEAWRAPPQAMPTPWLLGLLGACVGLPFFAVAANAPLLQRWFARTGHPDAHDPYFLYSASNLGSVIALLSYPVLLEPTLSLGGQSWLWTTGYALLVGLIAVCGYRIAGTRDGAAVPADRGVRDAGADDVTVTWRERGMWVALACVPSGLLLSVTAFITTDIVAVPLLWVVPLSLYLLTFVFVFARRQRLPHTLMLAVQPPLLAATAIITFLVMTSYAYWLMALALLTFFVTAMVCHGELARRRPAAACLTEFYVWMSLGGILGGTFTAILAPVLFDRIYEFSILLVLAALLRPRPAEAGLVERFLGRYARPRVWDLALPGACLAVFAVLDPRFPGIGRGEEVALQLAIVLLAVTLAISFRRPLRLGLAVLATVVLSHQAEHWMRPDERMFVGRSFFGVYRVSRTTDGSFQLLTHGTTIHGAQATAPPDRRAPNTYYHRDSGVGRVFQTIDIRGLPVRRVGAIGLGAGEIACYRRPGQRWTFFEIDPLVARVARDPGLFTYLADCAPDARIVIGDGRRTLARYEGAPFDMLVVDAFTSDAIPLHLLTREALRLYVSRLSADGLLMIHVSNRHLNLEPVVAELAADARLSGAIMDGVSSSIGTRGQYRYSSTWVALARSPEALERYLDRPPGRGLKPRWRTPDRRPGLRVWTDDYSNILSVIH